MKHLLFVIVFIPHLFTASKFPLPAAGKADKILFTENKGQVSDQYYKPRPDILFGGISNGMAFHLRSNGISYQLQRADSWKNKEFAAEEAVKVVDQATIYRLDINWKNCNEKALVIKEKPSNGYCNYYLESCPNGVLGIKSFEAVTYRNIYNGINLRWYEKTGQLKYDFICEAGVNYKSIQLEIKGAEIIRLNEKHELEIVTPLGTIVEKAPVVLQNGKSLRSRWIINGNVVSFEIEALAADASYIIDPAVAVRTWGTYYGGTVDEISYSCTTDKAGNVFLAGFTTSPDATLIATAGAYQTTYGGGGFSDAFLAKFNFNGARLWATYYGGAADDRGTICIADSTFNIYLAGASQSSVGTVIASMGSYQPLFGGGQSDAFVAKFDSAGTRIWGTYYGGPGADFFATGAISPSGALYFCGRTDTNTGTVIATPGSQQQTFAGGTSDAFLVNFNSAGNRLWATYYGGTGGEDALACAVDAQGNIFIGGWTTSTVINEIATPGSHQSSYGGGPASDAYLVKFNSNGVRQWGTYYGGTALDQAQAVSTDRSGNVFLAGYTQSTTNISSPGSYQPMYNGPDDAFLVKFDNNGMRQWGTYYGDTGDETARACFNDSLGNIYIGGYTNSSGTVIASPGTHQPTYGGGQYDGFVTKFNASGLRQWATYYGGTGYDRIWGMTVNSKDELYICGHSVSSSGTTIATAGSFQNSNAGSADAFLVKFCGVPDAPTNNTPAGNQTLCVNSSATLMASSTGLIAWFAAPASTNVLGTGTVFVTPTLSAGTYTYYAETQSCVTSTIRTAVIVTVAVCTGLQDQVHVFEEIYPSPNPNNGEFQINSTNREQMMIELADVLGRNVLTEYAYTSGEKIRISDYPSGVYFLKIKLGGRSQIYKILKE